MLGTEIILCIAGNKSDLEKNRTVSHSEAEAYAASVGAKHFKTSAKYNDGVDTLFLDLTNRMLDKAEKGGGGIGGGGGGGGSNGMGRRGNSSGGLVLAASNDDTSPSSSNQQQPGTCFCG